MGLFNRFITDKNERKVSGKKQEKNERMKKEVESFFGYVLTIYNEFIDKYSEYEDYRKKLNPHSNEYMKNLEHGIQLAKKAYDKIEAIPYVYNIPKATRDYIKSSKEQFLMIIENYIKRDESIRDNIKEAAKCGKKIEISDEATIPFTVKAHFHMESATNYMDQARQSFN